MWPFNRKKKTTSNYPKEVQEYYQSERRERTSMAWLLAIGTLIVTLLLAMLLFFGGRWVYRQITGNNDDAPDTVQVEDDSSDQDSADSLPDFDDEPADEPQEPNQLPGNDTPAEPTPSRPERTPSTGPRPLPRTGPDGPEI